MMASRCPAVHHVHVTSRGGAFAHLRLQDGRLVQVSTRRLYPTRAGAELALALEVLAS